MLPMQFNSTVNKIDLTSTWN